MRFSLSVIVVVGMEDDGYPKGLGPSELEASCNTVRSMAASLQAVASVVGVMQCDVWGPWVDEWDGTA